MNKDVHIHIIGSGKKGRVTPNFLGVKC